MKPGLVDINVWFALLVAEHEHHQEARNWYSGLAAGEAVRCRIVQLGVIRLLGTATMMKGNPIPTRQAWDLIQQLLEDERVEFAAEPADLDELLPPLFRQPGPTPKLLGDAYLAAFALASSRKLVTRDGGFTQFRGLQVELVGSPQV